MPEIRIENGKTLVDVVLREPIDKEVAIEVLNFCRRNPFYYSILKQRGSAIKSFPDGRGGMRKCPESFQCNEPTAILGLGDAKSGREYSLIVNGEDEFAKSYVERIYSVLPTVDIGVISE